MYPTLSKSCFFLLFTLCDCMPNCLAQNGVRFISVKRKADSIRKYIPKHFNVNPILNLADYDTTVILNESLLALGKGKTERYRKYTVQNKLGKILLDKVSFINGFIFKEGAIPISTPTGEGFLLETGRVPFRCTLVGARHFEGGLAHINNYGDKLPGIDYTKSVKATPYHYKGQENPFNVLDNFVNKKFELMIPHYYDSIAPHRSGKITMVMKNGLFGFLDTTGHEMLAPTLTDFDGDDQYGWQHLRRVQKKGRFGFVDDCTGQLVIPFCYEATVASIHPFTWVRKSGKWGCINQNNTVLIPFQYDNVSYFDSDSISLANLNGRMGHIRANGSIVTPLLYESVWPFFEGLALVQQDGRYGYVNRTGQLIIPNTFVTATNFREGKANVERFGLRIKNDKQGRWISYQLGTGWNFGILLSFLSLIVLIAYRRQTL